MLPRNEKKKQQQDHRNRSFGIFFHLQTRPLPYLLFTFCRKSVLHVRSEHIRRYKYELIDDL